jgi:hypothetical protein
MAMSLSLRPRIARFAFIAVALTPFTLITFSLVGCAARPVHYADGQNVPLFDEAGQVQASLGYQFEKGMQSNIAVAVSPQLALHAGAAYAQEDNCHSCTKEVTRHVDLGFETFRKLESGYLQGLVAGGGLGRFKTLGTKDGWDPAPEDVFVSSGKYYAFFLQGHRGKRGRIFEQAGSLRLSAFRYFDFQVQDGNEILLDYPNRHWGLFLEPAYTVRGGYKAAQVQCQTGVSIPLYQPEGLSNSKVWLNVALVLNTAR